MDNVFGTGLGAEDIDTLESSAFAALIIARIELFTWCEGEDPSRVGAASRLVVPFLNNSMPMTSRLTFESSLLYVKSPW